MSSDSEIEQLSQIVRQLADQRVLSLDELAVPAGTLASLGLESEGNQLSWPSGCDPLSAASLQKRLTASVAAPSVHIDVLPVASSTNDWLRNQAQAGVAGHVVTAECQVAGKGRLGRAWSTPVGGSIAVSIGARLHRPAEALGGLSLVVGLAVLDAVDGDGSFGLALKWPNDVQVADRKLGGILIEIVRTDSLASELIIGIGLNYQLTAGTSDDIDKPVIDLKTLQVERSRNDLLATVIERVYEFVAAFELSGFARFREAFNAVHRYHGRSCRILQGATQTAVGEVAGVDDDGRLLLQTASGIESINAGEVSLREH